METWRVLGFLLSKLKRAYELRRTARDASLLASVAKAFDIAANYVLGCRGVYLIEFLLTHFSGKIYPFDAVDFCQRRLHSSQIMHPNPSSQGLTNKPAEVWRSRLGSLMCRRSLIDRYLGRISLFGKHPFDDEVTALKARPLAMFFYNQRAVFLGVGFLYLLTLAAIILMMPAKPAGALTTLAVLGVAWVVDIGITFALHQSFVRRVNTIISSPVVAYESPPLYDRYFIIDSAIVVALILIGKILELGLDAFVALLFANIVVYSSAYIRGGISNRSRIVTVLLPQALITLVLLFGTRIADTEPHRLYLFITFSPIIGMFLVTVPSLLMISWVRGNEQEIANRRIGLLATFQRMLSQPPAIPSSASEAQYSEKQFRTLINKVLKSLCTLDEPFWYSSACLWLFEKHQDRGKVRLPAAMYEFPDANEFKDGFDAPDGLLDSTSLVLLHSLRLHDEAGGPKTSPFRANLDAPAAFIPLVYGSERMGVLALYGREDGVPLFEGENTFLWSLSSILINTMEQWEAHYRTAPIKEMDELFVSNTLDEVFPKAVKIMKRYLEAGGCMVVFRPDPTRLEMEVKATDGFNLMIIAKNKYLAGIGQTGKSAQLGKVIRCDYVPDHVKDFDEERLNNLEKAHKKPIISWMAIPIGPAEQNYGVIKVVNSTVRCSWFTDYDEQLGQDLARRLQIMIEKFLHIKRIQQNLDEIKEANRRTQENAERAKAAKEDAEMLAKQRQEDLMIITHQLQGPLSSLVGSLSYLQTKPLPSEIRTALEDIEALVEDSIAVCYGTFTTFALLDGRKISFVNENINAPQELRRLCGRLQGTNSRSDLRFSYFDEPGFPMLKMDRNLFTSVVYSLIHNAMKYADEGSRVILECSIERRTGELALKVKSTGQEILSGETERIFDKFSRGKLTEKTGRRYSGVGLGLWIARQLMRAVGGDVFVEVSQNNPRFSVFVVRFP